MKIDRLIGIVTILLQQERITAPELAERFEVSRRTINRDIEDICKAGIPLVTTQGYGGGISVADGYRVDKTLLTEEEMQMIVAAVKGIDSVSKTSYMNKLPLKNSYVVANGMIMIDLASHYQATLTEKIHIIKRAIRSHKYVSFKYYYEKGEQQRTVEPYRLVFKWSSWYLFGYCTDREAYRLFKLNRLWELEQLDKHFEVREIPSEELGLGEYLQNNNFHLKASFAPSEKYRLIDEYGIDCCCADENGRLLFDWDFASYDNMQQWILSFGDRVKVLEPQELQEDRKRQAENILKMH